MPIRVYRKKRTARFWSGGSTLHRRRGGAIPNRLFKKIFDLWQFSFGPQTINYSARTFVGVMWLIQRCQAQPASSALNFTALSSPTLRVRLS
jgi:hypothetical protein